MKVRIHITDDPDFSTDDWDEGLREEVEEGLKNDQLDAYLMAVKVSTCDYVYCPHHSTAEYLGGIVDASGQHGLYDEVEDVPAGYMREVASDLLDQAHDSLKEITNG